jgi:hypothetical protein
MIQILQEGTQYLAIGRPSIGRQAKRLLGKYTSASIYDCKFIIYIEIYVLR